MLMKGSLHSDELLGAVVDHATGLRTERRISHVFIMDVPLYAEPLFITDAAVNIFPTSRPNATSSRTPSTSTSLWDSGRRAVAILSAVETVTPKIPSTLEAAALCKMADRKQIVGGVLDGPLALDNAIDPKARRDQRHRVGGGGPRADLGRARLEAGNMLAKNLTFLAGADAAGVVLGARVPIVLTSRADNLIARRASCAVAALYAQSLAQGGERTGEVRS